MDMTLRHNIVALVAILHGVVSVGVGVASVMVQTSGEIVHWRDVALFGGGFLGLGVSLWVAAALIVRGYPLVAKLLGGLFGAVGLGEFVLGGWMVLMALSGPTDSYIAPIGMMAASIGAGHLAMAVLALWPTRARRAPALRGERPR